MFNVINDAWIKTDKGKYGIYDLLKNAPDLKEIEGENPLNEFAIYRFLFTFLMDALQVETIDERDMILDNGEFDMSVIDAYIDKCRQEGVSFDIFDKERPFLQDPGDFTKLRDDRDCEIRSIGKLDILKPTGTNKRFFDKEYESMHYMADDEIARYLPTPTIHLGEGRGFGKCISGFPVYAIIKGKNLFETLMFGVIPIDNAGIPYGKPAWRMGSFIGKATKKQPVIPELLLALTLPIRRLRVIDNSRMYYEGNFFYEAPEWRDPYVPYFKSGDRCYPMQPQNVFYTKWTDYLALSERTTEMLKTVELCSIYLKNTDQPLVIVTYQGISSKARCSNMLKGEFRLPPEYIDDHEKIGRLRGYAKAGDKAAYFLGCALKAVFEETMSGMKPYAMQMFYERMDKEFERKCIEEDTGFEDWTLFLQKTALDVFDAVTLNKLKTESLIKSMKAKKVMAGRIKKIRKEEPQDAELL